MYRPTLKRSMASFIVLMKTAKIQGKRWGSLLIVGVITVSGSVKIARDVTMILMGALRCFVIHAFFLRMNLITVEGIPVQEEQDQFDELNSGGE